MLLRVMVVVALEAATSEALFGDLSYVCGLTSILASAQLGNEIFGPTSTVFVTVRIPT